ncbi:Fic family protein [Hoylesella saccharolytica]|uniref:Fic family protein n=1 Tax=Hoylesella saccharolytica TaxID=633701 RepID=UPI0028E53676|nr:Fic family protein [Hoylesella saccharolytica]
MDNITTLFNEWQNLQPIDEQAQRRLDDKFMLEFNYNSNHIEGNTLTYGQTELLFKFGDVAAPAKMRDLEEMKAHNVALKYMEAEAREKSKPLTERFIRDLHQTLLREDYEVPNRQPGQEGTTYTIHAGIYKTRPNSVRTVTGELFEYASPEETPLLIGELVAWYNQQETAATLSPIQLAALFHYRYIRIHPFEDGNGRIARLLVNYILGKHGYPMLVVKSRDKNQYLSALHQCDVAVGSLPSDGATASINQITPLTDYLSRCLEHSLTLCIKAARGESIEEEDDFTKQLQLLKRQADAKQRAKAAKRKFSEEEVCNVLEFWFFPITKKMENIIIHTRDTMGFSELARWYSLSKSDVDKGGLIVSTVQRETTNWQKKDFIRNAKSMWYHYKMQCLYNTSFPTNLQISGSFHITFEEDHYTVFELNEKSFPYGTYPSPAETDSLVAKLKQRITTAISEAMQQQTE